jgi:hypothetical protein
MSKRIIANALRPIKSRGGNLIPKGCTVNHRKMPRPQSGLSRYEQAAAFAHVIPAALCLFCVVNETDCFYDWL